MAEGQGGVSRRRVLTGVAWTAPVVLIATSVPARAASLETGGLEFIAMTSTYYDTWAVTSEPTGQFPAVVTQANIQNQPSTPGGTAPTVTSALLTFRVPIGGSTVPRWGLGSNNDGIANPAYTLSGTPSVSGGVFTISFSWSGSGGSWATTQPTLWALAVDDSVVGDTASATVAGVHEGGDTSSGGGSTEVVDSGT